jgi:hypothetical protein
METIILEFSTKEPIRKAEKQRWNSGHPQINQLEIDTEFDPFPEYLVLDFLYLIQRNKLEPGSILLIKMLCSSAARQRAFSHRKPQL